MEIKFDHVDFTYQENTPLAHTVLKDVNAVFEEKKIHGIIGKSGCGKSTLIELMNALLLPSDGTITLGSRIIRKTRKIRDINQLRYKVGLVFQFPEEQFFCKTVKKEIEFGMKYFNKTNTNKEKHIVDALKMVGLNDTYLDRDPFTLSSGEMRKVAIASILAFNPKVIILDEPTVGLDNKSKQNLIKIIRMLKTKYGKTIIIVSHDADMLHQFADKIFVVDRGTIVLSGNKYEVFTNPNIEDYGIKVPKIIEFEQLVLAKKGIKLGFRDDINDLMKDVYRYVK